MNSPCATAERFEHDQIETVGDCYVATAGLPDQTQHGHVIQMARFARDIIFRMHILAKKLEVKLGPDTADLSLRIGIHSGPITAGVLRGERARFQLFGDTVNVCQRLKTTSSAGRTQVSKQFAEQLRQAGKALWLTQREDKIQGLGETFWLTVGTAGESQKATSSNDESDRRKWTPRKNVSLIGVLTPFRSSYSRSRPNVSLPAGVHLRLRFRRGSLDSTSSKK